MNGDSRLSEMKNEVKLKGFETERTQMVHEDTVRNLKESQLEVEKLQKKTEVGNSYMDEENEEFIQNSTGKTRIYTSLRSYNFLSVIIHLRYSQYYL